MQSVFGRGVLRDSLSVQSDAVRVSPGGAALPLPFPPRRCCFATDARGGGLSVSVACFSAVRRRFLGCRYAPTCCR